MATNAEGNKLEGEILARISVRTLIVKEWKQTFWIITNGKLLMYRSKDDYLYVSASRRRKGISFSRKDMCALLNGMFTIVYTSEKLDKDFVFFLKFYFSFWPSLFAFPFCRTL